MGHRNNWNQGDSPARQSLRLPADARSTRLISELIIRPPCFLGPLHLALVGESFVVYVVAFPNRPSSYSMTRDIVGVASSQEPDAVSKRPFERNVHKR
jgi:hypothetical protein